MGDRHIPIIDEDKLDDIITALQALSAPSGTDVAISPTGMHIVTEDDVQGAISELDAKAYEINSSLAQKADSILFGNFEVMENLDNDDSGNTMTTTKDYKGGTNLYAIACVLPTTAVARAICFAVFNVTSTTLNIAQFGDRTISGTVDGSGHITFNFGSQYKHATIYKLR